MVGIFVLLLFSNSVLAQSAQEDVLNRGVERLDEVASNFPKFLYDVVSNVISYIYSNSLFILELNKETMFRFYMSVMLILIIFSILDMVDFIASKNFWIKLALSIGIGGLAIVALPAELMNLLMPSYESMFSTLFSFLPFGLILYFSLQIKSLIAGRLLWLFVTLYFILLFFSEGIPAFQNEDYIQALIYAVLAVLGLVLVIFLQSVRSWFFKGEAKEITEKMKALVDVDVAVQEAHKKEGETYEDIASGKD